jgi:hypothetical protein
MGSSWWGDLRGECVESECRLVSPVTRSKVYSFLDFLFAQVVYFKACRTLLVDQANRNHLDATEHYQEAKEYAKWSAKDREMRRAELPPLTPEQERQMRAYIRMMQEHHAFNRDSDVDQGQ